MICKCLSFTLFPPQIVSFAQSKSPIRTSHLCIKAIPYPTIILQEHDKINYAQNQAIL